MSYVESLLSSGESVQIVRRSHWITLVRSVVINGTAIALLVFLAGLGIGTESGQVAESLSAIAIILALVPAARLARDIAVWYSRQYVITTRRVMQISGVLNKRVSDSNLDKVNDVVMNQSWLGQRLRYGDIDIITGSDVGVDRLDDLQDPIEFKRVMMDNKEDFDTLTRITREQSLQPPDDDEDVPTALERLASLRDRGVISESDFEAKKAELLTRL